MSDKRRFVWAGLAAAGLLIIAGCSSGTTTDEQPSSAAGSASAAPDNAESPAPSEPAPSEEAVRTQEASCEWDSPRLTAGVPELPTGISDDLSQALIGSWQHTHIDSGAGFEPLDKGHDIRFVFPSADTMVYCQDIKGILEEQQNKAAVTLEGTLIGPAGGEPIYKVLAASDDVMLWQNLRLSGETYLLQRR